MTPEQHAQRTWCDYLEVLYQRATGDHAQWSRRAECISHASTASPVMLERTAKCSRKALDGFKGDPLTSEYAAQVRRCGAEAIEAATLSATEVEPFVEVLCQRAVACSSAAYSDCKAELANGLTTKLGRAIGSINLESRAALRECLQVPTCEQETGERLSECMEPIMRRLLWLPVET